MAVISGKPKRHFWIFPALSEGGRNSKAACRQSSSSIEAYPSYKMELEGEKDYYNQERAAKLQRIFLLMESEKRMAEKCRQQRAINQRKKVSDQSP